MKITICSSANFYQHVIEVKEQLESMGHEVFVPKTALKMLATGDYDVSHYKTWFADANDYHKKAELMLAHFAEIEKADAILVVNDQKHGIPDYIGGNVLMEMAIAFYLKQKIYVLGSLPKDSPFEEEIKGVLPIALHNDLSLIA